MLNVLTPKGQKAEQEAREAILKLSTAEETFAWFPENNIYPVDGFCIRQNTITSIFEGKTRQAHYQDGAMLYNRARYDDYLITAQKLDQGIDMAKQMRTDFLLYVYFVLSGHVLCFKIWDDRSCEAIGFRRQKTVTQAGVNGGQALRENAYIPLRKATVFHLESRGR